ncbi:MAG: hypothetical protein RR248_06050 [Clostridia bacterium]
MPDETRINIDLVAVNNQASTSLQLSEQQLININIQLAKAHKLASSLNGAFKNFQQTGQLTSKVTQWQKQQGNLNVFRQAKKNVTTKTMLGNAQYVDTRTNAIQLQAQKKAIDDQIKMSLGLTKAKQDAKGLDNEVKKTTNSTKKLENTAKKVSFSNAFDTITKVVGGIAATAMAVKKAVSVVGSFTKASGDWIENLNLFEVTFGNSKKEAMNWAQGLVKNLGVSANEIVRVTGLFKQMTSAIGIANETTTKLGMTLPTLGLDISSFYNTSVEQANEMLRATIAGQVKPGRQYGFDVSAISLDKYMEENLKLDYTSKMLNQSDKALLRMVLLLDQSKNAWGDMATTLPSYSNQLKMLTGSLQNMKLAIGDALIKPATEVIKIFNGIAIAITEIIRAFVPAKESSGFDNITKDITNLNDGLEETEKNLGLLSFDKFESLTSANGGADTSKAGATESITAEFNKLNSEYMEKFNEQMAKIKNEAKEIAEKIKGWFMVTEDGKFVEWTEQAKGLVQVIAGIAGFGIIAGIKKIKNATGDLTKTMKLLQLAIKPTGLIIIGIASALLYMYTTNEDFRNSVNNLISTLLKLVGSALEPIVKVLNILMPIITKLLEVIGSVLAVIVNAISWVVDLLEKSHLLDGAIWVVIGTLGILATAWAVIKIIDFVKNIGNVIQVLKTLGTSLLSLGKKIGSFLISPIGVAIGGVALLMMNIGNLIHGWDDMGGWERAVGIIGAVAGAIMLVVGAIAAFHGAWSLGTAVAAIAAGLVAVGATIASFTMSNKRQAEEMSKMSIPKYAQGGYPDRGQMFIAGEAGAEMVANIGGGQSAVANIPQIEEAMYRALKRISREESQVNNEQNINLQLDINGREFARATYSDIRAEGKRRGY